MTTASNLNELSKTLKKQRLMTELTLCGLAARSGVSASHLDRIERGERFPSGHILRKIAKPLDLDESLLMTMAGYLSPESSSETGEEHRIYKGLDPYVANVLSEEPVHVQRTIIGILTILKSMTKGKGEIMGQGQALAALQVTDNLYKEGKITKEESERIGNAFLDRPCKSLLIKEIEDLQGGCEEVEGRKGKFTQNRKFIDEKENY